jgi:hypothetical protein
MMQITVTGHCISTKQVAVDVARVLLLLSVINYVRERGRSPLHCRVRGIPKSSPTTLRQD